GGEKIVKPKASIGSASKNQEMLHDLQSVAKSLQAMQTASDKKKKELIVPQKAAVLAACRSQTAESVENSSYGEVLIAFLQDELNLPENGSVRMELTIDRFGRLVG